MNLLFSIPLFYQLLQAYKPIQNFSRPTITTAINFTQNTVTPTPKPIAIAITTPTPEPKNIGGEGKILKIAVLGDSMIETLGPNIPSLKKSLNRYFPDQVFNIRNYGTPSSDIEYGIKTLNEEIIKDSPDIIVIESYAYNNFGNTQIGIDRQWLDLGSITTTIKNKLPNTKIVLAATIAPNSISFCNGTDNHFSALEKIEKTKTIKTYLQNIVNFATSQHFPLANAYQASLNSDNEGYTELINSSDNIHPSDLGAEVFSDAVSKAIYDNNLIN